MSEPDLDLDELLRLCDAADEAERATSAAAEAGDPVPPDMLAGYDEALDRLQGRCGTAMIRHLATRTRDAERYEAVLREIAEENADTRDAGEHMPRWQMIAEDALAGKDPE